MEQDVTSRKREIITALAVLIVIVVIVGAVTVTNRKKAAHVALMPKTDTSTSDTPPDTQTPAPSTDTTTAGAYTDGSYTATGSYDSPGGNEKITVHITLAGDIITATSASSGAGDPEAREYQDMFISGYKQLVVGKNIASVRLSRVSGSSLTSQGFNNALAQIKQQAKA